MEGIRKGTSRAPSPTRGSDCFVCFQSSRRDTFMRHGAIHAEGNSWRNQFMPARAIHWPSAEVPPPAGSDLNYWERVKFQTDKPSTVVSNPSVKNRLRRADFCHLPLHKGGMGALRTRRISPCIRGRAWRASRTGRRGRRPLQGCGGNGTIKPDL